MFDERQKIMEPVAAITFVVTDLERIWRED
jgi:hypothetical protein